MSQLAEELNIKSGEMVGFVGAGGKTTTLQILLSQLRAAGRTVLTTSTVHLFELKGVAPHPFVVEPDAEKLLSILPPLLAENGHVRVAGERLRTDKIRGLEPEQVDRLRYSPGLANLLVECDGARHRSLKAPAEHEPVIPASVDILLVVAGLDILGKPLNDDNVHRLDQVREISGLAEGAELNPAAVAQVITSRQGGLKNAPEKARIWAVLTKWTPEIDQEAHTLAAEILARANGRIEGVIMIPNGPIAELSRGDVTAMRQ